MIYWLLNLVCNYKGHNIIINWLSGVYNIIYKWFITEFGYSYNIQINEFKFCSIRNNYNYFVKSVGIGFNSCETHHITTIFWMLYSNFEIYINCLKMRHIKYVIDSL